MAKQLLSDHAVVIASAGRPDVLGETLASLAQQTSAPTLVVLSLSDRADIWTEAIAPEIVTVFGEKGSSLQRNRAIDILPDNIKYVSFLDDDVELEPFYLERINAFLNERTGYVVVDGLVLHDGDISRDEARAELRAQGKPQDGFEDTVNAYGCNLTVHRKLAEKVRFDERLRLYAWLEDADFTRRCLDHGGCARVLGAQLVHLRAAGGRVSGKRYGFAQIANSYYLSRKGQMSLIGLFLHHWLPAIGSNALGALGGNPTIDRAGRLHGNLIALRRIIIGRCDPEYVELIE